MTNESHKIFVESSLFLAFIDRANLHHPHSISILESLAKQKYQVFTSILVVIQVYNRAEKDLGTIIGLEFIQAILESNIQILYPSKSEVLAVFRFFKNRQHLASFSEVLNSVLMDKQGVSFVLTYDSWANCLATQKSKLIKAN